MQYTILVWVSLEDTKKLLNIPEAQISRGGWRLPGCGDFLDCLLASVTGSMCWRTQSWRLTPPTPRSRGCPGRSSVSRSPPSGTPTLGPRWQTPSWRPCWRQRRERSGGRRGISSISISKIQKGGQPKLSYSFSISLVSFYRPLRVCAALCEAVWGRRRGHGKSNLYGLHRNRPVDWDWRRPLPIL